MLTSEYYEYLLSFSLPPPTSLPQRASFPVFFFSADFRPTSLGFKTLSSLEKVKVDTIHNGIIGVGASRYMAVAARIVPVVDSK